MTSVQSLSELTALIYQVRSATASLALSESVSAALLLVAKELDAARDAIFDANTLDLEASLEMAVPDLVIDWLKLTPDRLHLAIETLRNLAHVSLPPHVSPSMGLPTRHPITQAHQWQPLGVIAFVYEAFPEFAIIAAGLCLRTGNGLILKGGNEASQTNLAIAQVFADALDQADISPALIQSISPSDGESARRWLMQSTDLDLIIPYGRASLVNQVMREAHSPVLATAIGNCYLYWGVSAEAETVARFVIDSHASTPDPVNGIEKVLIHADMPESAIGELVRRLREANLTAKRHVGVLYEGQIPQDAEALAAASLNGTVMLISVDRLDTAIALMNTYSSGHANAIATESYPEVRQFTQRACSSTLYVNTSPRFMRNPPQAAEIALGMSAQRGLTSGRIGLDTLLSRQRVVHGLG